MYDAIVVGAGFAGLRAASDLAGAGASVVLLEARDRVGGRTWTRPFAGDGPAVEMGGSWFTAEHELVPGELRRHGLTVRTYGAPSAVRWRTGGVLRDGLPVPFDQLGELDRALTALARDAETPGARTDSRSFAGYLESLKVPEEVGDFLTGWWTMITGTDPAVGAVADPLTVVTSHGGVSGLLTALRYAPVEGWSTLSAAMAAVDGVELRSGAAVELLAEGDAGVRARLADGGEVEGRVAIVALPVNVLPHVGFEPPLPPPTAAATGSNAGRAIKLWVRARGVEPGVLAAGVGDGINWFYGDRDLDGDSLMLGFGFARPDFDPSARADAERAVRAFFPGAEVLAWDWHDWNADPWSRGTWATATVGDAELLTHARFPPHGRLAFATSDIAPREAGWIEGAMVSGAEAASWALELLGRG